MEFVLFCCPCEIAQPDGFFVPKVHRRDRRLLQVVESSLEIDSLKNENPALKAEKKDLKQTIKQLKSEFVINKAAAKRIKREI